VLFVLAELLVIIVIVDVDVDCIYMYIARGCLKCTTSPSISL